MKLVQIVSMQDDDQMMIYCDCHVAIECDEDAEDIICNCERHEPDWPHCEADEITTVLDKDGQLYHVLLVPDLTEITHRKQEIMNEIDMHCNLAQDETGNPAEHEARIRELVAELKRLEGSEASGQ